MRRNDQSWPYPGGEDQPSWPAGDQEPGWPYPGGEDQPGWPYPGGEDQPSWPTAEDQPRWSAAEDEPGRHSAGNQPSWPSAEDQPNWPPEGDFPSWPAGPGNGGWSLGVDHPSWPAGGDIQRTPRATGGSALPRRQTTNAPRHDQRLPASPSAPAGRARVPGGGAAGGTPRRSGPRASVAGAARQAHLAAPQAYPEAATGGGAQALLTEDPPIGQQPGNGDSVRLAERVLSDADQQAAAIRQQALEQAAAIRQAAEREAEQVRQQAAQQAGLVRDAEREAEQIRQQAAYQAGQIREAAAREADELRAGAIRLSAELGQVAEYVTRSLTIPAIPVADPQRQVTDHDAATALPAAEPGAWAPARPAGRPPAGAGPAGRTATRGRPPGRPASTGPRPAGRPGPKSKGRQIPARNRMLFAFVGLTLLGLALSAAQIAQNGFAFFVFRNAGAGAGNSQNLGEDQGPGQPDAPGAHHGKPSTSSSPKPAPSKTN